MDIRPKGSAAAFAALFVSAALCFAALVIVHEANDALASCINGNRSGCGSADANLLAWGGLVFGASVVAGVVAVVLWWVRDRRSAVLNANTAHLASPVGLVDAARDFVMRLHRVVLGAGLMVLLGGLGLVAAASLVADGTPTGPFSGLPWKVWVVELGNWQVEVTTWALVLLGLALAVWSSEYRWTRRLRAAWLEPAPEV